MIYLYEGFQEPTEWNSEGFERTPKWESQKIRSGFTTWPFFWSPQLKQRFPVEPAWWSGYRRGRRAYRTSTVLAPRPRRTSSVLHWDGSHGHPTHPKTIQNKGLIRSACPKQKQIRKTEKMTPALSWAHGWNEKLVQQSTNKFSPHQPSQKMLGWSLLKLRKNKFVYPLAN